MLLHFSMLVATPVTCKTSMGPPRNQTAIFSDPIIKPLVSCKGSVKTKKLLGHGLKSMMNTVIGLLDKLNSVKVNS